MTKLDVVEEIKKKLKEVEDNQIKLLDGYYKCHESLMVSWKVDGDAIDCKDPHEIYDFNPSIEYGDFGKRHISLIYLFFPQNVSFVGEVNQKLMEKYGKGGENLRYNMILKYSYIVDIKENNEQSDEDAMKVK